MASVVACWKRGRLAIALIILLTAGLAACSSEGGGGGSPAEMGKVTLSLPLPGSASREKAGLPAGFFAPAPDTVQSIRVEASGPGIATPVSRLLVRGVDFTESTDPVTVTLEVPAGLDRAFVARAFASSDGSGEPIYQGSTVGVTIVAGPNRVDILLFTPPFASPTLADFTPTSGCNGTTVTINGTNFDPIAGNNTVLFLGEINDPADDRMATVVRTPTPTRLTVIVPPGALSGPIQVGNLRGNVVSAGSFTVSTCAQGSLLFGNQINLSHNAGNSGGSSVAASGNSVFVAWADETPGNDEIFLARSADGGKTFGSPVNLSNNAGISAAPSVAVSGNTVVVAWYDETPENREIFLARSTDGGKTFASPVNLSNNAGFSISPSVAASGNSVVVAWHDETPGNSEIFLSRSTDAGKTFTPPVNLSNNAGFSFSAFPSVAVLGDSVFVAWHDQTPGNFEIFLARSTDGGKTFTPPVNLSNNAGFSLDPSVAVLGDSVFVAWMDETPGNSEIFLARSTDGGATFSPPVNFSNNAGLSGGVSVAVLGDSVVVAWMDTTQGNWEIFLVRSTDGGATFTPPVNLSSNAGFSANPSVAVSGDSVVVAWTDDTPGNQEIFLARAE